MNNNIDYTHLVHKTMVKADKARKQKTVKMRVLAGAVCTIAIGVALITTIDMSPNPDKVLGQTPLAATNRQEYMDDESDETPLQIYLSEYDQSLKYHIEQYNKFRKGKYSRRVEVTNFVLTDRNTMYDLIRSEIAAGSGPDLFYMHLFGEYFWDFEKAAKDNLFADMDVLIQNRDGFDLDDYNNMVMDASIIDNKRSIMPLSYEVKYIMSTKENFRANNLRRPWILSSDKYLNLLESFFASTEDNVPAYLGIRNYHLLDEFIPDNEPIKNTKELKRLLDIFKIQGNRGSKFQEENIYDYDNEHSRTYYFIEYFVNDAFLFLDPDNYGANQFALFQANYNTLENLLDTNMVYYKAPQFKNNSADANISESIAINMNSTHKNAAFDFVMYLLSEGVQSKHSHSRGLPVNKNAYKTAKQYFKDGGTDYGISKQYLTPKVPWWDAQKFIWFVESARTCDFPDSTAYIRSYVFGNAVGRYYNDEISFDTLVDEMNQALYSYYNE
ncbi:MAG: hypothetical protein KAQ68_07180 [Clostridiales bacterium]|nr:hypothetical protein [Clostridiales bacterium]